MRITSTARKLALAAVLAALAGAPVIAQDSGQQPPAKQQKQFGPRANKAGKAPPPPEVIAEHGAWKVQCEAMPPAEGETEPRKQCGMVQAARSEKNEKVGLTVIIIKTKKGEQDVLMMRAMAPIGVYLPTGVAVEVDGTAVGRVPFSRCLPQACVAFAEASQETLDKLKKGGAANFIVYEAPGLGIPVKISLEGFSASLDELAKL